MENLILSMKKSKWREKNTKDIKCVKIWFIEKNKKRFENIETVILEMRENF